MTALVNDQGAYFHRLMQMAEGRWQSSRTYESWDKQHQLTLMGQYIEHKLAA
ncbi:MAG: hypothetical protein F6K19_00240 [Cyanothece sp. SIO1E1]|nr:hypothetical protein [Cyanothece sp. SIO1E1]